MANPPWSNRSDDEGLRMTRLARVWFFISGAPAPRRIVPFGGPGSMVRSIIRNPAGSVQQIAASRVLRVQSILHYCACMTSAVCNVFSLRLPVSAMRGILGHILFWLQSRENCSDEHTGHAARWLRCAGEPSPRQRSGIHAPDRQITVSSSVSSMTSFCIPPFWASVNSTRIGGF